MASDSESERSASPVEDGAKNNHSEHNISLRFIVNSKEAGGIIGKGGQNVKSYREESGARINISDGTASERIVVLSGTTPQVKKAFKLIAERFEEDLTSNGSDECNVSFRLVVPNSNCGSLIGKSGANIKQLREATGASIQVANEMLPNSTERNVTLAGNVDSVMQALDKICTITVETKPKGPHIPYQPGGQRGYGSQPFGGYPGYVGLNDSNRSGAYGQQSYATFNRGGSNAGGSRRNQYSLLHDGSSAAGGSYSNHLYNDHMLRPGILGNPLVPSSAGGGGRIITKEIPISSDSVGSIIGRQGTRINDIRQSTGAQVRVSDAEEGSDRRKVIITGSAPNVRAASYIVKNICSQNSRSNRATSSSSAGHDDD